MRVRPDDSACNGVKAPLESELEALPDACVQVIMLDT